jgi:hypothetical protein
MGGYAILFAMISYSATTWRNDATSFLSVKHAAARRHFADNSRK